MRHLSARLRCESFATSVSIIIHLAAALLLPHDGGRAVAGGFQSKCCRGPKERMFANYMQITP